jgi:hypothetical protein
MRNAIRTARTTATTPTAMPAVAPVLSPVDDGEEVEVSAAPVAEVLPTLLTPAFGVRAARVDEPGPDAPAFNNPTPRTLVNVAAMVKIDVGVPWMVLVV